ETLVIGNGGCDSRLLQHDFRKPDAIGITRAPPWQIALELHEPPQQFFSETRKYRASRHDLKFRTFPSGRPPCGSGKALGRKITRKYNVRGVPQFGGNRAAWLRSDDNLERLRIRGQLIQQ